MARLLCYVVVLVSGSNWSRHTVLCHLLPYGGRTISIFYQFIQFLGATAGGEVERCVLSPSLPSISLPIQQSTLRACFRVRLPPSYPARPLLHPTLLPWRPSRVGWIHRKTKTENILSCFISFTDEQTFQQVAEEHDAAAIFTYDDFIILSPQRPSPRKFDKSQNL